MSEENKTQNDKPRFVGEKVRLGEVLKSSSTRNKDNRCANVYSVTNSKGFVPSEEYFSKEVFSKELKTYRVVARDMIAYNPSRINVGSVALQDKADEVVVSPLYVVFSTDRSKLKPEYLVHFLKSKPGLGQIAFQSIGTVRNNLKFKALCQMELSIPSLEEQEARLKTLREIQLQITQAEAQIEKLDQLVKSRFVEMFGSYVKDGDSLELVELCEFVTVGIANAATHAYSDDGIVMLRNLNVRENKLDDSDLIRIKSEFAAKYAKKSLKTGDVLVTRTGYPGIACVVPEKYSGCQTFTTLIARLKNNAPVIPLFLSYWINSPSGKEFVARMKAGSSQQNFGATSLKLMPVPIPPLELQQSFSVFVQQVDKPRFAILQQIEKLETLKASLMQEYFG